MPITVVCHCGRNLKAPDSLAGRVAKCPKCGAMLDVPVAIAPEPEPEPIVLPEIDLGPGPTIAPELASSSQPIAPMTPMNVVGFISLCLSIISLILTVALYAVCVMFMLAPFGDAYYASQPMFKWVTLLVCLYAIVPALLAGFALLVSSLGQQKVVERYAIWAMKALLGLMALSVVGVVVMHIHHAIWLSRNGL